MSAARPPRRAPRAAPRPAGPPTPRSAALSRLARDAKRFPDLVPTPLEVRGLDTRDAALAHAIHEAVIRRWWTLQALIVPHLNQPFLELETRLRAALLAGSAQLVLLDRIPPHAAISETVEWAKREIRPGAGKMVNAVLRKVAGLIGDERSHRDRWSGGRDEIPLADGRALALQDEVLPADPLDRLSAATSVPRALIEAWAADHGEEAARRLALHTLAPAPVILNTTHSGPLPGTEPHERAGFAVYTGEPGALAGLLERSGEAWVQDPASAEAVASVADLSPGVVVDLCAGRGTKTRQLAVAFPEAEIVATDTDRARFATLADQFEDHPRVRVVPMDRVLDECLERAELVLLDVPCSNTGVLARRPEAKYRYGPRQAERLTETQRQIVADSIRLLAPGGAILYSTCSLQDEENGRIARWAKKWHAFAIERERRTLPAGLPGEPAGAYHDASYSVLLRRAPALAGGPG